LGFHVIDQRIFLFPCFYGNRARNLLNAADIGKIISQL